MQAAEAQEYRLLQPGNHPENALLLFPFQLGLESHQVESRARLILMAQLNDCIRGSTGARVFESHRLQWPIGQRFSPPFSHLLDGRHPSKCTGRSNSR